MTQTLDLTLSEWMTRGGDSRIVLDPATGLNRYHSAPIPRDVLAFASSTANDLSADALDYLSRRFGDDAGALAGGAAYARLLDQLRAEIRAAYALDPAVDVFFAPSGTDLEYVGLLAIAGRRAGGIVNLLLGADEVGSGCIHSAAGRFFAHETALGAAVSPGEPVPGLPPITMGDLPVRQGDGEALDSGAITSAMEQAAAAALDDDRAPLVHIVHGSKTGLVLPRLEHVDALRGRFGEDVAFVVDACQARITTPAVHEYLARGVIVFLTGSKFMGGPPFSGFALLPPGLVASAHPLAAGMAQVFRRAEVPARWPGREHCEASGNPGLALRLAASLFELARFQQIPLDRIARIVAAFTTATDRLAAVLGIRKVASLPRDHAREPRESGEPSARPLETQTLVTLDLCHDAAGGQLRSLTFDDAVRIHLALIDQGIRLGQPVRCVRLASGEWAATLRIGLSMPQVVRLDRAGSGDAPADLDAAMRRIGAALAILLETA